MHYHHVMTVAVHILVTVFSMLSSRSVLYQWELLIVQAIYSTHAKVKDHMLLTHAHYM